MPQEFVRQADAFGLEEPQHNSVPSAEKVADLLKASTPWSGPLKVEE